MASVIYLSAISSYPVSQMFSNSSKSFNIAIDRTSPITQRKKANPTNTCQSLGLSNCSLTRLPFHEPSHPFSTCPSLTFSIFPATDSSTHLPIFPHTRNSSTHLSIHLPIPYLFINPFIILLPTLLSIYHYYLPTPSIFPLSIYPPILPSILPIHPLIQSLTYSSILVLGIF